MHEESAADGKRGQPFSACFSYHISQGKYQVKEEAGEKFAFYLLFVGGILLETSPQRLGKESIGCPLSVIHPSGLRNETSNTRRVPNPEPTLRLRTTEGLENSNFPYCTAGMNCVVRTKSGQPASSTSPFDIDKFRS